MILIDSQEMLYVLMNTVNLSNINSFTTTKTKTFFYTTTLKTQYNIIFYYSCLTTIKAKWFIGHQKKKLSDYIFITRGPQALTVTWVSETLHWLHVFVYQQPHHRINENQWSNRLAASYSFNTIVINVLYMDRVEDNTY